MVIYSKCHPLSSFIKCQFLSPLYKMSVFLSHTSSPPILSLKRNPLQDPLRFSLIKKPPLHLSSYPPSPVAENGVSGSSSIVFQDPSRCSIEPPPLPPPHPRSSTRTPP
ncbi:hypothetical protein HanRHA438_Chr10g0439481 [Helianthus annuus]|nr:hypothetical protein HanRHA438_Chr10g0439481 [Helianthus annuus]